MKKEMGSIVSTLISPKLGVVLAVGFLSVFLASCIASGGKSQAEKLYEKCTEAWYDSNWPNKPDHKALVAGDGPNSYNCYYAWGYGSVEAAVEAARSNCYADYPDCFDYAWGETLVAWAKEISSRYGNVEAANGSYGAVTSTYNTGYTSTNNTGYTSVNSREYTRETYEDDCWECVTDPADYLRDGEYHEYQDIVSSDFCQGFYSATGTPMPTSPSAPQKTLGEHLLEGAAQGLQQFQQTIPQWQQRFDQIRQQQEQQRSQPGYNGLCGPNWCGLPPCETCCVHNGEEIACP